MRDRAPIRCGCANDGFNKFCMNGHFDDGNLRNGRLTFITPFGSLDFWKGIALSRLSPYWLWLLLALPAFGFSVQLATSEDPTVVNELLHPTGEFSARFMIIAMLASPLVLLLRGWRGPQWLKKNRRYFGVAAFGYAAMHTVLYLVDEGTAARVVADLPKLYIWTGWLAFVVFIPLAVTSMDYFVRLMGPSWKTLQRTTYMAAIATLVHWAALHDWGGLGPALVHFGPLAVLETYRVWYWYLRPRSAPA